MPEVTLPIKPGGMYSDIVETDLGPAQHQEVTNFRLDRDGQWRTVRGYLNSKTGLSDVRAAVEVTDDQSGDRCILFQSGYGSNCLKRLDYDSGDGDGYENETPTTLALPSGITIGDITLRFQVFRGVVRITGGSKPLWYAYVEKTLHDELYRQLDIDDFEGGTESWTGNNATVTQSSTEKFQGSYSLSVVQTDVGGGARKTFTIASGKTCSVKAW